MQAMDNPTVPQISSKNGRTMTSTQTKALWLLPALAACAVLLGVHAAGSQAAFSVTDFGGSFTLPGGEREAQAGGHPDFTTKINFSTLEREGREMPDGNVKNVDVELPQGLFGNPTGLPTCTSEELSNNGSKGTDEWIAFAACPVGSQVGIAELELFAPSRFPSVAGIYNVEPPRGVPAMFGFNVLGTVVRIIPEVRGNDFGLTVHAPETSQTIGLASVKVTFWGVPADPVHDPERWFEFFPDHSAGTGEKAFMTVPTNCNGPMTASMRANSWEDPDTWSEASFNTETGGEPFQVEDCDAVPFDPSFRAIPDTADPDAPVGLNVKLGFPQEGLEEPTGIATSPMKKAVVTLPEGMTINPASAAGLGVCTDAQLSFGQNTASQCPANSKIGTITASTPLLEEQLTGGIYLRPQNSSDPESGELFRLALAIENPERGVFVKLPGSVRADRESGQLTATVDNSPQLPITEVSLQFKGGPRAPLANPKSCGKKTVQAALTSWSGKIATRNSTFEVACGGGGFSPSFTAGAVNPLGGGYSPFALSVSKPDGQSELSALQMELPPGLLANLRGKLGTQVGSVSTYAGTGPSPIALPGKVFLGGPYKGAPYSLRVDVPAVAGPFDLGLVTVKQALYVDPVDAHVKVISDPLPTIVSGVPVRLQRFDASIDRPEFTINPTDCSAQSVTGLLGSDAGQSVPASVHFQAANCAKLGFQPKLSMRMVGAPSRRGGFPALKATLTAPEGQANIGKATVLMPKTELLEQNHIRTLCTRAQWAEDACPAGSVYGKAKAFTPLLDKPLEGNVYLRSNGGARELPDLVADLKGQIDIELVGYIDAVNARLRARFLGVPDAPVSKFVLEMQGGKKGLLAHNTNVCKTKPRASVQFDGQNGKVHDFNPLVAVGGCGKKGK